jgi:peptide/nickel transport system substrate-binding protein
MSSRNIKLTRRDFLRASSVGAAAIIAAGCTPSTPAPASPTEAPKPTEAAAATAAPQPTAAAEATAAPTAAAEATAAPTAAAASGGTAAGQYKESPMLADMVKAGKLPPVAERLPAEPLVLKGVDGPGVYSARLNTVKYSAFGDLGHPLLTGSFAETNDGKMYANAYAGFEASDDKKSYTIHIRKGLKWSDGEPHTTADVKFWYEDEALNTEISPTPPSYWVVSGEFCKLDVIDDYTFKVTWPVANSTLPNTLRYWAGMYFASPTGSPSHYLKKYHKKYNPDIEAEAKKEGFDTWVAYYGARKNPDGGKYAVECPALRPWVVKEVAETHLALTRNPYFWAVDEQGNQLPYFDEVLDQQIADKETMNLKVVAGEADYAGVYLTLDNMQLYLNGQEKGNYKVFKYKNGYGNSEAFSFNRNVKDPVLNKLFNDLRWNQAMSFAINRQEVQESVFQGTGVIRAVAPNPDCSYYKKEWENYCTDFDLDKANSLLDELGLDKKDKDGFRLRSDGQTLTINIEYTSGVDSPVPLVVPVVKQHWEKAGVKVVTKEIERQLYLDRGMANEHEVGVWHVARTNEARLYVPAVAQLVGDSVIGETPSNNEWWRYHASKGKEGIQPPAEWEQWFKDIDDWHSATTEDEYKRLGEKIMDFGITKQLRLIGTVGFTAWPIVVKNGVMGVPKEGYMGDDTGFARSLLPETWYRKA